MCGSVKYRAGYNALIEMLMGDQEMPEAHGWLADAERAGAL